MDFIQHSITWAKGELFESTIIGLFGVLVIAAGLLFWKFGQTPASKAMLIPLALAGLIFSGSGVSGYLGNQKRIAEYEAMRQDTPVEFVQAEKERVEGFSSLFTFTLILAPVCFATAVLLFIFTLNPHARAAAVGLTIIGLAGLVIDFFAKERADIYYGEIVAALKEAPKS